VAFAGDPWLPRLPRWYVGDAIGVLVVAPALLALPGGRRRPTARAAACCLGLALISLLALGPWRFGWNDGLLFLTLPVLIVIALRYGTRGAAAGVLMIALIVETVTASDAGPFGGKGAFSGLFMAQMFVAMSAVTAMTVAVLTGELVRRERLEAELRALALRDSLTGLANRRLLFDRIEHASRRLKRRPGMLALLFIDLDGFKAINDTYGHATGDALLVKSAERLRASVRDQDTVARLGGDEFLVLVDDIAGEDDALRLAARIVEAFDPPFAAHGSSIGVTASVGVTTATSPVADPSTLVSSADGAMYHAKRAGGRRVAIAGPQPQPGAPETVHLAAAT
jgi:diguanylate cyclase (GGDEF)-like protein